MQKNTSTGYISNYRFEDAKDDSSEVASYLPDKTSQRSIGEFTRPTQQQRLLNETPSTRNQSTPSSSSSSSTSSSSSHNNMSAYNHNNNSSSSSRRDGDRDYRSNNSSSSSSTSKYDNSNTSSGGSGKYNSDKHDYKYSNNRSNEPTRNLWVGRFPNYMKKEQVLKDFSEAGRVESIHLLANNQTPTACAFVNFYSQSDAVRAKKMWEGTKYYPQINFTKSRGNREREHDAKKTTREDHNGFQQRGGGRSSSRSPTRRSMSPQPPPRIPHPSEKYASSSSSSSGVKVSSGHGSSVSSAHVPTSSSSSSSTSSSAPDHHLLLSTPPSSSSSSTSSSTHHNPYAQPPPAAAAEPVNDLEKVIAEHLQKSLSYQQFMQQQQQQQQQPAPLLPSPYSAVAASVKPMYTEPPALSPPRVSLAPSSPPLLDSLAATRKTAPTAQYTSSSRSLLLVEDLSGHLADIKETLNILHTQLVREKPTPLDLSKKQDARENLKKCGKVAYDIYTYISDIINESRFNLQ